MGLIGLLVVILGVSGSFGAVEGEDDTVGYGVPHWLPTATNGADVVVVGEVTQVDLSHMRFLGRDVQTFVTLDVESVLKGPALKDTLVFWAAFAAKEGERVTRAIPPFPAFAPGDVVMTFLEADEGGELYARGMALEISGGVARTPEDILYRGAGTPTELYKDWVNSFVSARSPENLTQSADAAVVVEVRRVEQVDGDSGDFERVTAHTIRTFKGPEPGVDIAIGMPARDVWDLSLLSSGDVALVFLRARDDGSYEILGGREGAYLVDDRAGLCHRSPRRRSIPALPRERRPTATFLSDAVELGQLERRVSQSTRSLGR